MSGGNGKLKAADYRRKSVTPSDKDKDKQIICTKDRKVLISERAFYFYVIFSVFKRPAAPPVQLIGFKRLNLARV